MNTIGKKILKLRKDSKMTQTALAARLHVSNRTISKWETDISTPDISMIIKISKIFNVDINLLVDTENINIETRKTFQDILIAILKFIIKNIIKIVFFLVSFIFFIYFLNNYNSIKIYDIKSSDKGITIDGGYFFERKSKNILIINNIKLVKADYDVILIKTDLFTYVNGDKVTIYESDNLESINISEIRGYKEHLSKDIIKAIKKGLYLSIDTIDEDDESHHYEIKMSLNKNFSNDKLIYFKDQNKTKVDDVEPYVNINNIIIDEVILINNDFTKDEVTGLYRKDLSDGEKIIVDLKSNKISIYKEVKKKKQIYNIFLDKYLISFQEITSDKNNITSYTYNYQDEELDCTEGNCKNYLEDKNYIFGIIDSLN